MVFTTQRWRSCLEVAVLSRNRSARALLWNRKCTLILGVVALLSIVHICFTILASQRSHSQVPVSHSRLKVKVQNNRDRTVPLWFDEYNQRSHASSPALNSSNIKLIVLSYMRSGSTLTGDLLQAHPDVFYVYEPLMYLWDFHVPNKKVSKDDIRQRTKQYFKHTREIIPEPLEFINYIFNCNISTYNLGFLTNTAHSKAFVDGDCPFVQNKSNLVNLENGCAEHVSAKCKEARVKVQKVVRLTMKEADRSLTEDPNLRVIHLVRDPRGILLSRMNFNRKTSGEMHNNYTSVCQRILEDIKTSKDISERHWGRILTVRYEDIAQDPLAMTATLYSFVGLELLPSVRDYLEMITSRDASLPGGKIAPKKTSRKNPFKTAYKWRHKLTYSLVKEVDAACGELYSIMGYVPFDKEEQMRDFATPAKIKYYGDGLMTAWLV